MGGLVSRSGGPPMDVFVDLENARPQSADEERVHAQMAPVVDLTREILVRLRAYRGCEDAIKEAITHPTEQNTNAAWQSVLPNVHTLKEFYEFSVNLKRTFPELLRALCAPGDAEATLGTLQSLTRQLACIMDFCIRFDDIKINTPPIQNDFSFYRRTLAKIKLSQPDMVSPMNDDFANFMSMFYAAPTPMMKCLCDATSAFAHSAVVRREYITECFSTMANLCYSMCENRRFATVEANMFCLRAMTASIIIFDHIDPVGAFHKKSKVRIKQCIATLRNFGDGGADVDVLLNALRHTTVHYADSDTPSSVKQLLQ